MKRVVIVSGLVAAVAFPVAYSINRSTRPGGATSHRLGLPQFYAGHHSVTKTPGRVEALSEPEMGWLTYGRPVPSPTRVATQGLQAALAGDEATARLCADWLLAHSRETDGAISFPFEFDFVPYWPYELRAPWTSAITQGLALGLFTQLYAVTGNDEDLARARRVAAFYARPIENGGFTRFEAEGPFFEEYPCATPTRVLNGAIVAMLALHDFARLARDDQALALFHKAADRMKKLLPAYEFKSEQDDCILSLYSLAPLRPRVLMRFKGAGRALIHAIRVRGQREGRIELLAELRLAEPDDANPMRPLYVWYDEKHMNWGPPTRVTLPDGDIAGRIANDHRGDYDHSPFVLGWLPDFDSASDVSVEVDFVSLDPPALAATIFDGVEFWPLGSLNGPPRGLHTAKWAVPPAFPLTRVRAAAAESRVDYRYLDDNQRLLEILAGLTGDLELRERAARWRDSRYAVPARWMNWASIGLVRHDDASPVLKDHSGCRLLGQPALLVQDDGLHLFYVAVAHDGRARLYLATSADGNSWVPQGQVFSDSALPMVGDVLQPAVAEVAAATEGAGRYLLVFTLSGPPGQPQRRLCTAYSDNGWNWRLGELLPPGEVIDVALLGNSRGGCDLYYLVAVGGFFIQVMHSRSADGRHWSFPQPAVTQRLYAGGHTEPALCALRLDGRTLIFLERSTRQNRHVLLYAAAADGPFLPCPRNPVYVCDDWEQRWDAVRAGWCIVPVPDRCDVYYGGAARLDAAATEPVPVGRATLNLALLREHLADHDAWRSDRAFMN